MEEETYFSKPEHIFPHLEDGKIPTQQFLSACQGIADFVGFLGTAFLPVRSDIAGNVQKVRTKFITDQQANKYLQDLIDNDLNAHGGKLGIATEGLLWLKRGLEFMLAMLGKMIDDYQNPATREKSESLVVTINQAYEKTLKIHHGFVSAQIFKVIIRAVPYRSKILRAIAMGASDLEDVCIAHMQEHRQNFALNVQTLVEYYELKGLEQPRASTNQSN